MMINNILNKEIKIHSKELIKYFRIGIYLIRFLEATDSSIYYRRFEFLNIIVGVWFNYYNDYIEYDKMF